VLLLIGLTNTLHTGSVLSDGLVGLDNGKSCLPMMIEVICPNQIWMVHNVLTPQECQRLIDVSEKAGTVGVVATNMRITT
jgi:hypothetical protein